VETLRERFWDPEAFTFALGVNTILLVIFWFFIGYYHVLASFPQLQKYQIELRLPYPSKEKIRATVLETILNHLLIRPILLYFTWPLFKYCGVEVYTDIGDAFNTLPSRWTIFWQVIVCMQVDDFWFYWSHRLLHHRWVYKYIHKKHHEFRHSIPIAVEHAHPIEDFVSNTVSTLLGPLLLECHTLVLLLVICMKLWQSIDAHSGYDFPFPLSPWSAIKYMDCAPAHDFHHSHNVGNYGGYFMFWDKLCGTDEAYVAFQMKEKDGKKN